MKKRKTFFWGSLLLLSFCSALVVVLNPSDRQSQLLMLGCLIYLCLFILMPAALASLRVKHPVKGGLLLILMLFPLVAAISFPSLSLTDFELILDKVFFLSDIRPGLINFLMHALILFSTGCWFISANRKYISSWKGVPAITTLYIAFYIFLFIFLYIQPPQLMHFFRIL